VHADVGEQHDQIADHGLVELRAAVVFRKHALERGFVGFLDRLHRRIDQAANVDLAFLASRRIGDLHIAGAGIGLEIRPPCQRRHPEHARGEVFFRVFRVRKLFSFQPGMLDVKSIRNVLQEDQPKRDMLVFRRLKIAAQLVGGLEQLRLEAKFCSVRSHACPLISLSGWLISAFGWNRKHLLGQCQACSHKIDTAAAATKG